METVKFSGFTQSEGRWKAEWENGWSINGSVSPLTAWSDCEKGSDPIRGVSWKHTIACMNARARDLGFKLEPCPEIQQMLAIDRHRYCQHFTNHLATRIGR